MSSDQRISNRLAHEKSPYLLQHARNPVDWFPWGPEAFEVAHRDNKPVFLSIGYSTCHWCHVMERESFEDPVIAAKINEYFVAVKVDREERPDLDHAYMTAVQAMAGQGGWPLTVFLTPDKKPFYGGTYFPPQPRWGTPGILQVMESIHQTWQTDRRQLLESSAALTERLREWEQNSTADSSSATLTASLFEETFQSLHRTYDVGRGGFGQAPKFPSGHTLAFLLRHWQRTSNAQSLTMVKGTLDAMARGGIYDHLGGGFHRYATDAHWHVPHFEKMLYDQAILLRVYAEGFQVTKDPAYAAVMRETAAYVLREMRAPEGGFYSAEDADSLDPNAVGLEDGESDQKEGAFYVWSWAELHDLLGVDADLFAFVHGVEPEGNARSDPHGEFTGQNILFQAQAVATAAQRFEQTQEDIIRILERSHRRLFEARARRPRPHLDDKILTDWNGLMIGALAFAGRVLRDEDLIAAAGRAADFQLTTMLNDGRLRHRHRDGEAAIDGTLSDYVFLANGLLDLYEATFEPRYLEQALRLTRTAVQLFWDTEAAGFFMTAADQEAPLFRHKESYDGALPSGNSMGTLALVRLYHFTLDDEWNRLARSNLEYFSSTLERHPAGYTQFMMALDFLLGPSQEIVLAGAADQPFLRELHCDLYQHFIPRRVLLHRCADLSKEDAAIIAVAPFLKDQPPLNGEVTFYLCEGHVCRQPTTDPSCWQKQLRGLAAPQSTRKEVL